jgi:hemolysin activation/secretion protein
MGIHKGSRGFGAGSQMPTTQARHTTPAAHPSCHRMGWRALVWALGLGMATAAWAQTPPPVPPVTPAPAAPVRTPSIVPPSSELAPPVAPPSNQATLPASPTPPRELGKPDDDLRLDVAAYSVDEAAPAELRAALGRLTAPFVGPQRSFEDLVNAAAEVTRFLQRDLGYYLGYAYIPEQSPQNTAAGNTIRIAVLEGRLDRVVLNWRSGLPVDREVVEAYLARLKPGSVLKVRDVERVVFLVNDLRGMTARFEVRAGSVPGTATLVVTPSTEKVYTGKVDVDANGAKALGEFRIGGLAQMNSPFGRGDGITGNVLVSTTGGLGFALLGYNTPIGSDGFKAGVSLSAVRYQLDKETFPLDLNGTAATFNAFALYPVVRSRNLNLFTLASLEHKAYTDRQGQVGGQARKSVDAIALGLTGDFRDSLLGGAVNTFELNLSSGQLKYPEGRNPALDDDDRYTKLTYGASRLQDWITGRALIYLNVRGQYAANNLDTTEQFRLGGPDGVRAFSTGEGTGDIGVVTSLELRLLPPESWFGRTAREMVFSLFVDGGYVQYRYRQRLVSETNVASNNGVFSGIGLGLSWVRPGGYALRFSVAQPTGGSSRSGEKIDKLRAYVQATMLFN